MMQYKKILALLLPLIITNIFPQEVRPDDISFIPIKHATLVIQTKSHIIFVDPVGDSDTLKQFPNPDIILITDIHGDHFDHEVIKSLKHDQTVIIGPMTVINNLGFGEILMNAESKTFMEDINIKAIPMYNLTKERLKYHVKGNGNGYVLTLNNKRIYISGDTEDIEEMRTLEGIDYAFICMNLPYTMSVEQAASAVLEMKPKVVFPYHHRGSDVEKFKHLVRENMEIEVRLLNWYP